MPAEASWQWTWLVLLTVTAVQVAGVVLAVDAVMRNRTPQGTIAWAIALLLMPAMSIPFYVVFGSRRFNGYVRAIRRGQAGLRELWHAAHDAVEPFAVHGGDPAAGLCSGMERITALPATRSNVCELLVDGQQTFDAILAGVARARDYVLSQFYIVNDDGIGRRYRQALLDARARGVRVHFLYDEIGCSGLSESFLQPLRDAGCQVSGFRTTRGGNRFQINFRNHRKTVVIDGHEAFTGGINVGDEYLGLDPEMGPWRDTQMRLAGPAVMGVQLAWCEDWRWATGSVPELNWRPQPEPGGENVSMVVPSGPADPFETCTLMFLHLITSARRRLWVATPYFVPDEGILAALQLAARRGVDVRVMIPERADNLLIKLSAYSFYPDVIPAGVKVYRYHKAFLHHKVLLADDTAAVGTANFDNRSFRINFEMTVLAEGPFCRDVTEMMHRDFERCHGTSLPEFERRSWWFRLATRIARLMAPIQ
jgi:cardiolipin synthase